MRCWWLPVLVTVVTLGCAEAKAPAGRRAASEAAKQPSTTADRSAAEVKKAEAAPAGDAIPRKIIYRATVELVVEDFEPVPARVRELVKQFGAYVARSNTSGRPGIPRRGQWTLRVPSNRYDDFIEAARQLGEVRRVGEDSQDVTEEFYDVEARIRNKKQEEKRLLTLLDTATGKLEEVLAVEKELSRVRGEVEQAEGRIRVLSNLTALATVELQVDEIKDYVPEQAAGYSTQVRRAWERSLSALVSAAQGLSIFAVAAAPWLGVLLVPVVLLIWWIRRLWRR